MQTRHSHCPEHVIFPAGKMIPKEYIKLNRDCGTVTKRELKKTHIRRSRQFLKRTILDG